MQSLSYQLTQITCVVSAVFDSKAVCAGGGTERQDLEL